MKKKLSLFRLGLLGVFFILALLGFFLFSTYKGVVDEKAEVGEVVIWGTLDQGIVELVLLEARERHNNISKVVYVQINRNTYQTDVLEAIASGQSPDLIIVSNESLYGNLNKIYKISSEQYPIRSFIDTYVDAFSIFYEDDGIWAIPFVIDPMVMYYNKDIFATNSIAEPPKFWDEFDGLSQKMTIVDDKDNIKRATIAFGEVININNFKGILSTLFMQLGNKIIYRKNGEYITDKNFEQGNRPAQAINFYLSFSNQINPMYSWNRSLPSSKEFFLSGKLATYFGFSSEIKDLRLKNPNLNFDVAEIPNVKGSSKKTVFANVWGFAIPKASGNIDGAFTVAQILSSKETQSILSKKLYLPPVRRDLLNVISSGDIYMDIFFKEAIFAKTFMDPDGYGTSYIFKSMVERINGGKSPEGSITTSFSEIDILLGN
ncbi:MAG: extracellular solute-binding protein [Candidatus Pacebacteria bacterium]|nr:extracellular solute-binding protein [Candidatus Paceibacterota bacterium]